MGIQVVVARAVERSFESKRGTVQALGPMDLDIATGEFVAIVGPSGCGKTTFLKILAGLINPTAGEVRISNRNSNRRLSAMVFQEYGIFPWATVRANVRFGLDLEGRNRKEADRIVDHWIERVGIIGFADALPSTLSGGMRQRVAIARAFASDPQMLLMDEPFAALDAQLRTILQDELLRLWESDRRSVVFVTHSIEEAIVLADRIVLLSARPGRIIGEYRVPFPRPRAADARAHPEFGRLKEEIWSRLRDEVEGARATH
jgi:NitT/TauT family transport system ATP-binding protein